MKGQITDHNFFSKEGQITRERERRRRGEAYLEPPPPPHGRRGALRGAPGTGEARWGSLTPVAVAICVCERDTVADGRGGDETRGHGRKRGREKKGS
jgi:hypothetical protein